VSVKLLYWMHQLVVYLLGLLLLSQAARVDEPLWLAVGGVMVVLLASLGDAPLSAFRRVPRPVHRIADLVVAAVLVVLALTVAPGGTGRVSLLVVALALAALAWRTDFRPRAPRTPLRDRLPDSHTMGRYAGRGVGKAVVAGRSRWRARKG
jgi:hypothetical protein